MKKEAKILFTLIALSLFVIPFGSAGVGVRWNQETAFIPENSVVCLTYGIYNPWPTDSYVQINLSESLQEIVKSVDTKVTSIPQNTFSNSSIPVEFCFKTPKVYEEKCKLFDKFLCKQDCTEEMKVYEGEVQVSEVSEETVKSGGSGGSSTAMSVSAPLRVKVKCVAHSTNYSLVYALVGIIALAILTWRLYKRRKKERKK